MIRRPGARGPRLALARPGPSRASHVPAPSLHAAQARPWAPTDPRGSHPRSLWGDFCALTPSPSRPLAHGVIPRRAGSLAAPGLPVSAAPDSSPVPLLHRATLVAVVAEPDCAVTVTRTKRQAGLSHNAPDQRGADPHHPLPERRATFTASPLSSAVMLAGLRQNQAGVASGRVRSRRSHGTRSCSATMHKPLRHFEAPPGGEMPNHVPRCVPLKTISTGIASSPTCRCVISNRRPGKP